jgi:hypothetical protein
MLLFINISVHLSFGQLYPHTAIPALLSIIGNDLSPIILILSFIFETTEFLTVTFFAI